LLVVRDLHKRYAIRRGLLMRAAGWVHAVRGVGLELARGETLGLVGESGSGKTTVGRCVLRLVEPDRGEVVFDGRSILDLDPTSLRRLRREMQLVFQDPYASLNPRMTVGEALCEPLRAHGLCGRGEAGERAGSLLSQVGLPADLAGRYPHDLSGGQRQRVAIARSLALRPRLLVCDEPVSALDVSVQAQILDLLARLREEEGLTYLFISHDLAVVRHVADRVAVMLRGTIVEQGDVEALFAHPLHPYTLELIDGAPVPVAPAERAEEGGCVHRWRCPSAEGRCAEEPPLASASPGHEVRCWLAR